ncbi:MSHA biogenesis protein MshM [Limimonas halophila]|uniref:MSHA biogenesis protein MshM n=1 Tax=Limimonas halophila TaxID=1082479 RepID=A0A1G7NNJ3_9PROT|nr:AAA family ATPase [Limimonas halophila]SDF75638.1 MSHA biogenesis protein MshM [Limimonas halophila]
MPYLDHFGFTGWPFTLTPNRGLFFPDQHQHVLESARFAVQRGEPIVKVSGEVGTGKTLLCRLLMTSFSEEGECVAFLALPQAGYHATMRGVAREFGLNPATDDDIFPLLSNHLMQEHAAGRRPILVVDEAQALGRKGLETIRLLSNLETDEAKLLQVVLFGQPELDRLVDEYGMRQIRQRITFSFTTKPFDTRAGVRYIRYRVQQRSRVAPNDVFTRGAMKVLVKAAGGIPRAINLVADRALLAAYAADSPRVTRRHARRAVRDAGLVPDGPAGWLRLGRGRAA